MSSNTRSRKGFDEAITQVSEKIAPLVPLLDERYIGYLDFLGFKKIVEIQPIDRLEWIYSELYSYSLKQISEEKRGTYRGFPYGTADLSKTKTNMLFVSDSIILWSNDTSIDSFHKILIILLKFMIEGFVYGYPARGALVKGHLGVNHFKEDTEFYVGGQFVYGPGFIKAVKLEESQNWSGCVIEKDCLEHYDELVTKGSLENNAGIEYLINNKILVKHDVPFKKVNNEGYVINWPLSKLLNEKRIRDAFSEWGKSIEDSQTKNIIKNTIDFFHKNRDK